MSKEYTEILENNYPEFMVKQHKEHIIRLERELRKSRTKIGELEKIIVQRDMGKIDVVYVEDSK